MDDWKILCFIGLCFLVYFISWIILCRLYNKETREWMVGPDWYQITGVVFFLCVPLGFYELIKAYKMNRNGTAPKTIKSVFC